MGCPPSGACRRASTASARAEASVTSPARSSAPTTSADTRSASGWPPGSNASARRSSSTVTVGAWADASRAASRRGRPPLVTPLRAEHEVVGHLKEVRAAGDQRERGLAVQTAAGRRGHMPVDRVVNELVPEHDAFVVLVETRASYAAPSCSRHHGVTGDGGDVAERHGVAEHGRDPQQVERSGRQVAPAGEPPGRSWTSAAPTSSPRRRRLRGAAAPTVSVLNIAIVHSGFPTCLVQQGERARTRGAPSSLRRKNGQIGGGQGPEMQGVRAGGGQVVEQPERISRQGRGWCRSPR